MAKPTQKALPVRPFDPNRTRPIPSNPKMMPSDDETPGQLQDERNEEQRFMAPSKRDQPTMNFCKGGKVISSRRM